MQDSVRRECLMDSMLLAILSSGRRSLQGAASLLEDEPQEVEDDGTSSEAGQEDGGNEATPPGE